MKKYKFIFAVYKIPSIFIYGIFSGWIKLPIESAHKAYLETKDKQKNAQTNDGLVQTFVDGYSVLYNRGLLDLSDEIMNKIEGNDMKKTTVTENARQVLFDEINKLQDVFRLYFKALRYSYKDKEENVLLLQKETGDAFTELTEIKKSGQDTALLDIKYENLFKKLEIARKDFGKKIQADDRIKKHALAMNIVNSGLTVLKQPRYDNQKYFDKCLDMFLNASEISEPVTKNEIAVILVKSGDKELQISKTNENIKIFGMKNSLGKEIIVEFKNGYMFVLLSAIDMCNSRLRGNAKTLIARNVNLYEQKTKDLFINDNKYQEFLDWAQQHYFDWDAIHRGYTTVPVKSVENTQANTKKTPNNPVVLAKKIPNNMRDLFSRFLSGRTGR